MEHLTSSISSERIRDSLQASIDAKQALLDDAALLSGIEALADVILDSLRDGGKLILFGNGGSAADSTHLAAEFVGRFMIDRRPLPAMSLTDNGSSVTAIGNDYSYEDTFSRPIQAFGSEGDVAIGLTTSGGSANVLAGLRAARGCGLRTAAITGAAGLADPEVAEICLAVPSRLTARVQECTMLVGHTLCEVVEAALFE